MKKKKNLKEASTETSNVVVLTTPIVEPIEEQPAPIPERVQLIECIEVKDSKGNVTKFNLLVDTKTRIYKTEYYFNGFPLKASSYIGKGNALNFWQLLKEKIK